jgi:glycosyltransferase involved in cell wall biosynthesis
MTPDVTVVVPVYNPGEFLDRCIDGVVNQTLSPERREVIFVNDGSTDNSAERLDRLSAQFPYVRVIHQPNSGWPGKPRNVGIEHARGDYIFFCDHDDHLEEQALERMLAMAQRTGADVLVPKMVSDGRAVPHRLFRTNIDHAILGTDPLTESLTPHKLFRRAFLDDAQIRFPEGKRRLEDHVFVFEAFLTAGVISVLSDYPCYRRILRHDQGNAALQEWDAEYYFRFVAEAIDVIEAHTSPGELRDALLLRPYAGEMLGKLMGKRMSNRTGDSRQQTFDEVRELALARFPEGFHERLPIAGRAHARALIDNRLDRMIDVAARTAAVKPRATLRGLVWEVDHWVADIEAELVKADGSPIQIIPSGPGWVVDPQVIPSDLDPTPHEHDDIEAGYVDVIVRDHAEHIEWYAPAEFQPELIPIDEQADGACRLMLRGTAQIGPAALAGGSPLPTGRWDVRLRMEALGIHRVARIQGGLGGSDAGLPAPALCSTPPVVVTPVLAGPARTARLKVVQPRGSLTAEALRRVRTVSMSADGRLRATLDLAVAPSALPLKFVVELRDETGAAIMRRPGRIRPTAAGSILTSDLAEGERLPRGRFRIVVKQPRTPGWHRLGVLDVARFGRVARVSNQSERDDGRESP